MLIGVVDTETTGFKPEKGDKIVEICLGVYRLENDGALTHIKTWTQRINPLRTIPMEAQRVHGITLEDLRTMPVYADFAPTVQKVYEKLDLVVIHNAAFDEPFINAEQDAAGYPLRKVPTFCTMVNGRWATCDGKVPSLEELAWALGIEFDVAAAHGAEYDTQKLMECFSKGLQLGFYQLEKGEKDDKEV